VTIWIDASSGASGDMLLGALVAAGVPVEVIAGAVAAVAPEAVALVPEPVTRNGFAATRCHVDVADSVHHRTWRDIRALLLAADLHEPVRDLALRAFERLAVAEATVHGSDPLDVSFHEVGALDAIADVVGVCSGFAWLARPAGLDTLASSLLDQPDPGGRVGPSSEAAPGGRVGPRNEAAPGGRVGPRNEAAPGGRVGPRNEARIETIVVSPVAVGSGTVQGAHGVMPVPPPAVAELLRGVPSYAGPGTAELCTPTGAALLTTLATAWGPQPPMTVETIGVGAGGRDPASHANVLRLFLGSDLDQREAAPLLIESNIDDLDPRVWPAVISALLAAGASDAWLTPILMKKGRPAHTLSVLVSNDRADAVRAAIFRETSTIGVRELRLGKTALDREMVAVEIGGQQVAVKLARHDGVLVNAQPEYDDVVRVAAALGRPVSDVLAEAQAASRRFFD